MSKKRLAEKCWFVFLLIFMSPLFAHEFWLEPESFQLAEKDVLRVHIKNGQDFKGDLIPYLPFNKVSFGLTVNGKASDIKARMGDMPAINQPVNESGLYSIHYSSKGHELIYDEEGKFKSFLEKSGLSNIWTRHKARGLPSIGFKENYYRFAKTLVQVGDKLGKDAVSGMLFEWLVLDDPYDGSGVINLRLLYQGKPLALAPVNVFFQTDNTLKRLQYKTDVKGELQIFITEPSKLLINSVKMLEIPVIWPTDDAVWESLWASLVLDIRKP